jgi:hypothetical protein
VVRGISLNKRNRTVLTAKAERRFFDLKIDKHPEMFPSVRLYKKIALFRFCKQKSFFAFEKK